MAAGVWRFAGMSVLLAAAGCASLDNLPNVRSALEPQTHACIEWYAALDSAVASAGVADAQSVRIEGFPYLRADRFSAALREPARVDGRALAALVDRLADLDFAARGHEISNLPMERSKALAAGLGGASPLELLRHARECSRLLRRADLEKAALRNALLERLRVPDDYVTGYRIAGLYALTRLPFSAGVARQQEETREAYRRDLNATAQGALRRYAPPAGKPATPAQVREILANATQNPLRVPEPAAEALDALFSAYAPSFEVETTGDYDRPGALRWRGGAMPEVDVAEPVVYVQAAHTRYRGANLLQLVYTIWFSERPAQAAGDILAGRLDGVVFRVTLAPDGSPLVYDTIHPCGCYHLFFTTPRAVPVPEPAGQPEWAFVPQALPEIRSGDSLVLRIASRTHYVERVYRDPVPVGGSFRYAFRPYDDLRSLPLGQDREQGRTRSVFAPDGIIAGTDRAEGWLFWPMGIANAGAMRQWGRHATAFVGRRHFDDADLLERRFVLELK